MHKTIETTNAAGDRAEVRASEEDTAHAALRFLIPTVADLLFVLLLAALTLGPLAKGLLGDAGIGWHIRTGQLILSDHAVPRVDPFSSTIQGRAWYAWEWLYDVGVGAIHKWAGLNGVVFASAVIIALTFTLLFRMMLARGTNLLLAVALLLPAVAASTIHFLARPHVLSWLLTLAWFGILDQFEREGQARVLFWLAPLMLVWVNLHGGFVVGCVLLGIYFVATVLGGMFGPADEGRRAALIRARALVLAGIGCLALSFANPYGYKLHVHIYRYLTDRFLMDHIDEFLSPNFHGLAQKCFAGLILLTVIAVAIRRKRLCVSHLLVILFAIYSGLYGARNIPVAAMLLALVIAPQLSAWIRDNAGGNAVSNRVRRIAEAIDSFGGRMHRLDAGLRGHAWPAVAVLAGMWVCGSGGQLGGDRVLDAKFDASRFPVAAVNFLERSGSREPVFCPDRWGGYLIYRLYPQMRVAVDDRHDFYGAEFLKRYLKIVHGEPGWDSALEEMKTEWVLVPADSAVGSLLSGSQAWRSVYRDETAVVFSRQSPVSSKGKRRKLASS